MSMRDQNIGTTADCKIGDVIPITTAGSARGTLNQCDLGENRTAVKKQLRIHRKRASVLVADPDPHMLRLMARSLELDEYQVLQASTGQRVFDWIMAEAPDLVILDLAMPNINGLEVCERVRESSKVPIIIVTALSQDHYKIASLEAGADDYITKPFNPGEFVARVHAVLRRAKWSAEGWKQFPSRKTLGSLTVDFDQCLVIVDGRPVTLTATEFRILAYLAENAGRVLTPDLLLEHIWNWNCAGERNLLKVNISRLRRKIEPDPTHPIYIVTKNGMGYLMPIQPDKVPLYSALETTRLQVRNSG